MDFWEVLGIKKAKKNKNKISLLMAIAQKIQFQELVELDLGDLHYSPPFTVFIYIVSIKRGKNFVYTMSSFKLLGSEMASRVFKFISH